MDAKMTAVMSRFDDKLALPPRRRAYRLTARGVGARKIPRKREPIPESMAGDPLRSISGATYGSAPGFKYDTNPRLDSKARDNSFENPVRQATEVQIDS